MSQILLVYQGFAELCASPPAQSQPRLNFVVRRQRLCRRRADSQSVGDEGMSKAPASQLNMHALDMPA